ncbi:MAG TPA: sigma 54-interacting transcriptional regulator [Blastocatellia bacterium]|nr:sigma 54-interacting transcriptional regulator [Blastocatellia bacterium]
MDSVRLIQGETADKRLLGVNAKLKSLGERIGVLNELTRRDYLAKIEHEVEALGNHLIDSRAAVVLMNLIRGTASSLNVFCGTLLDSLIQATGAERGFVLFYVPESTEAEVVAARNFQTRNLSLEEYDFSRTLLRDVLQRGRSVFLEDASEDPSYSGEVSVIKFELKSIVAAPLKQEGRTVGAIYLENNSRPCAFDRRDPGLLQIIAEFAVFYLRHAHLLPAMFQRESRVFFDETKASKEIIGSDPKILALLETVRRLADSPATVLIEGESGTGKELVARALHYQSARRDRPFIAINCAAIPDNLLESELFGHEKGAFTGASGRYVGRIEQGDGGTVFLDEVSELAFSLQAKLLRFLQSNEFDRLGGSKTIKVDVRVVAATSKDLKALTEREKFQEALYYRLNVIPVLMPALRERKGDIPLLIDFFLEKFFAVYGKNVRIEPEVYEWLKEYSFPGNVRELENLIHRLVALAADDVVRIGDLPAEILKTAAPRVSLEQEPLYRILETPVRDLDELRRRKRKIRRALAEVERNLITRVLEESGGNLTEAASRMGLHRITLHRMLKRTDSGE